MKSRPNKLKTSHRPGKYRICHP